MRATLKYADAGKDVILRVLGDFETENDYLRGQIRILRNEQFGRGCGSFLRT